MSPKSTTTAAAIIKKVRLPWVIEIHPDRPTTAQVIQLVFSGQCGATESLVGEARRPHIASESLGLNLLGAADSASHQRAAAFAEWPERDILRYRGAQLVVIPGS